MDSYPVNVTQRVLDIGMRALSTPGIKGAKGEVVSSGNEVNVVV